MATAKPSDVEKMTQLTIRPSMLSGYPDCNRRAVARNFRPMLEELGFKLRDTTTSVGAQVGSAVHAGAAYTMQARVDGVASTLIEAEHNALDTFDRVALDQGPTLFDPLSPNRNTAQTQIRRMVNVHRSTTKHFKPIAVERGLSATFGDFIVKGTFDVLTIEPGKLRDLKTGRAYRPAEAQVGTYVALARSHGYKVDEVSVDFLPRVPINKAQPPVKEFKYNVDLTTRAAQITIDHVQRDLTEFRRRVAMEDSPAEDAFAYNNQSTLCSDKYCPAWGTNFCIFGRAKP